MPIHKPIHPIFNNRWSPLFEWIAALLICMFLNVAANIWRGFFEGTIYGKVFIENGNTSQQNLEGIEISLEIAGNKKCKPVLTNDMGKYRFDRNVPVGYYLWINVKYGKNQRYSEFIGTIEGVKWLLGSRRLALPISSGIPKRVDLGIHPIISQYAGNP